MTTWLLSHRADPAVVPIADRHYSRQSIGSPQFVPPGRCLVLKTPWAYWVTSWPYAEWVRHEWAGAWICSAFRNERGQEYLSSDLIREAISITRWRWPVVPALGMVTFIDPGKVRHKRDPGRCFRKAGFRLAGHTKGGLLALQLLSADMPAPLQPLQSQGALL